MAPRRFWGCIASIASSSALHTGRPVSGIEFIVMRHLQDRLATLKAVREAGVSVCAGGIIGLGEGEKDRVGLIHQVRPGNKRCAV